MISPPRASQRDRPDCAVSDDWEIGALRLTRKITLIPTAPEVDAITKTSNPMRVMCAPQGTVAVASAPILLDHAHLAHDKMLIVASPSISGQRLVSLVSYVEIAKSSAQNYP
jgi:hypothetical protein